MEPIQPKKARLDLARGDLAEKFPNEVWTKILSHFENVNEFCQLELVSKRFRRLTAEACWSQIEQLRLFKTFAEDNEPFQVNQNDKSLVIYWNSVTVNDTKTVLEKLSGLTSISLENNGNCEKEFSLLLKVLQVQKLQKLNIALEKWTRTCDSYMGEVIQNASQTLTKLRIDPYLLWKQSRGNPSQIFEKLRNAIISCKELTSLNLQLTAKYPEQSYCHILASGTLTNLKKLSLNFEGNSKGFSASFADALLKSGVQLEELCLTDGTPAMEKYLKIVKDSEELLGNHPLMSLTNLTLDTGSNGKLLSRGNMEDLLDLCPALESLVIDLEPKTIQTSDQITDYIQLILSKGRNVNINCRGNVGLDYGEAEDICRVVMQRLPGTIHVEQEIHPDYYDDISQRYGPWEEEALMFLYQGASVRLGYSGPQGLDLESSSSGSLTDEEFDDNLSEEDGV